MFEILRRVLTQGRATRNHIRGRKASGTAVRQTSAGSNAGAPLILKRSEQLSEAVQLAFQHSLHIFHIDTGSCNACIAETMALLNPVYDLERFGVQFVSSPKLADMILVTGGVTRNLQSVLLDVYQQTPAPKIVLAVGSSAMDSGGLGETYALWGEVEDLVPVSVRVPGCPPRPQEILDGILTAISRYDEIATGERKSLRKKIRV